MVSTTYSMCKKKGEIQIRGFQVESKWGNNNKNEKHSINILFTVQLYVLSVCEPAPRKSNTWDFFGGFSVILVLYALRTQRWKIAKENP